MKAAWYLRSQQIFVSLRFWVAITGYDIHDRSRSGQLYLLYLLGFFGVWGLAMLALIASAVARGLLLIAPGQPALAAAVILAAALFVWWAYTLIGAARRSPIRFSAEDAVLVCATPISRPGVVFTWLFSEWFLSGVPFWGLGVVLGFSLSEIALAGADFWKNLPTYLSSGLRFFPPAVLLHLALLTFTWALGCWRLQANQERKRLAWVALAVLLVILAGGGHAFQAGEAAFGPAQLLAAPFLAGAGLRAALPALLPALAGALLGPLALWAAARRVNLSRAAQETESSHGALARLVLDSDAAETAALKSRLKKGHAPARLPARPGGAALIWKNAIQLSRSLTLTQVMEGGLIFSVALGALFAPDWAARSLLALYWIVNVNQQTSRRLRKDLSTWFVYQSLPLTARQRLWMEALPDVIGVSLLSWAALAVAQAAQWVTAPWTAYLALPLLIAVLAATASLDVVRQTRAEHLFTGNIPTSGVLALLLSAVALAASLYMLTIFQASPAGLAPLVLLNALLVRGLNTWFADLYRQLGK